LIIPVFLYRHYVQDKGMFPADMVEDMHIADDDGTKRAGVLPYLVLVAGVLVVIVASRMAVYG
jgi:hypothetical protein